MADSHDEVARLIHETLEQLEWPHDPAAIAERVKRLDQGLPSEDEFIVLCSWLGRCRLIHKLDQTQMPAASNTTYQVPDLLATFTVHERPVTALIEVKSAKSNVLSFRPDYLERLEAYADLIGVPLLIAWKWRGIWSLFETKHLTKMDKNFNINWKKAIQESLLGLLAGDFSYTVYAGVGLHIHCRKQRKVSTEKTEEGTTELWDLVIDEAYFTSKDGQRVKDFPPGIQSVLFAADLQDRQEFTDTHIIQHFETHEQSGLFAHMALVRLLAFRAKDDTVRWRARISDERQIHTIEGFREGVTAALEQDVVLYVFDVRPQTMPAFLKDLEV